MKHHGPEDTLVWALRDLKRNLGSYRQTKLKEFDDE